MNIFSCAASVLKMLEDPLLSTYQSLIHLLKIRPIILKYPPFLILKSVIKRYTDYKLSSNQKQFKDKSDVCYFKLPCMGNLSHYIRNKLSKLC